MVESLDRVRSFIDPLLERAVDLSDDASPRLLEASLTTHEDGGLEPASAWAAMMKNEKPGGHGDRSVAVGVLDMALWDATAKLAGKPLCSGSGPCEDEYGAALLRFQTVK
jgi:L-alanine-DL-glutamate epimerase-like enolase superfamily enzyme